MNDPLKQNKAKRFERAISPRTEEERSGWQSANKTWWETNPMRYDLAEGAIASTEFSREFFREIDRRFLRSVRIAFPWRAIPFDNFIDFQWISSKDVLEVGVGMGTHAEILSTYALSYTGIDMAEYASKATHKRLELFGKNGRVLQMDAEQMDFPDAAFDMVWSWGVIHHSSDTTRVLQEIHRVLKPGGALTFMVYHQSLWNTYIRAGMYYGLLKGGFFHGKGVHRLVQENTDGALARYYTLNALRSELAGLFRVDETTVLGNKMQLLPLPWGPLKERLAALIPNDLGRWLTNRPLFGYMVVMSCSKV